MKAAAQAVGMDTVLFNTRGVPYEGKSLHLESIMFSTFVFLPVWYLCLMVRQAFSKWNPIERILWEYCQKIIPHPDQSVKNHIQGSFRMCGRRFFCSEQDGLHKD